MLEWTGERYLPWVKNSTIAYEHLHRYAYAATLVENKRVLDLASGEGYGSRMLAESAASVVGIDADENAVRHATAKYAGKTLEFIQGSITEVPVREAQSFDIIVCFEAIEHIEDHDRLMSEVKRLLKPAGTFVVSTPNKVVYDVESAEDNPFHLKELAFDEFHQLLNRYFRTTQFLGQRIHPSSTIWPMPPASSAAFHEFVIDRTDSEFSFIHHDRRVPVYFIALASDSPTMLAVPASVLVDHSNGLLKEKDQEVAWISEQLQDREKVIASQEQVIKWREGQIKELTAGVDWLRNRVDEMTHTIASHEEALAWRAGQVEKLQTENAAVHKTLRTTQNELSLAAGQLAAIHASSGWKLMVRFRALRERALPTGSSRRKFLERVMGLVRARA